MLLSISCCSALLGCQHFSRSTRGSLLRTAPTENISKMLPTKFDTILKLLPISSCFVPMMIIFSKICRICLPAVPATSQRGHSRRNQVGGRSQLGHSRLVVTARPGHRCCSQGTLSHAQGRLGTGSRCRILGSPGTANHEILLEGPDIYRSGTPYTIPCRLCYHLPGARRGPGQIRALSPRGRQSTAYSGQGTYRALHQSS